jgi:hypothetical protein
MSNTPTAISLRQTALEMPLVFIKRIPSKLEAALRALNANNAVDFTRSLERAARLHDKAKGILGNAAEVSHADSDKTSFNHKVMMYGVLEDLKHIIFAVRSTLERNEAMEHIKIEETDGTLVRPYLLSDKQAVETVRNILSDLASTTRQRIKAGK